MQHGISHDAKQEQLHVTLILGFLQAQNYFITPTLSNNDRVSSYALTDWPQNNDALRGKIHYFEKFEY